MLSFSVNCASIFEDVKIIVDFLVSFKQDSLSMLNMFEDYEDVSSVFFMRKALWIDVTGF